MRFAVAAFLLVACSAAPPAEAPAPQTGGAASAPPTAARGLSCDSAIALDGTTTESAWIDENYPGARRQSQEPVTCNGKPAEAVHIVTANGRDTTIYFYVSGKS